MPYLVDKSTGRAMLIPTAASTLQYATAYERVGDPRAAHGDYPCTLHITAAREGARKWAARKRLRRTPGISPWKAWDVVKRVTRGEVVALRDLDYCDADTLARHLSRVGFESRFGK